MTSRLVSGAGFLAMALGVAGLILTRSLFSPFPPVVGVQVGAVLLMLWARRTLGARSFHMAADPTDGELVTAGPYRVIRHPIYTAVCLFVWAGALAALSVSSVLLALLVTLGAVVRILCEERLLVDRYPEFRRYAARTKRMVPYVF